MRQALPAKWVTVSLLALLALDANRLEAAPAIGEQLPASGSGNGDRDAPAPAPPTGAAPVADVTEPPRPNTFYVEGLGSGLVWSFNYDRRLARDFTLRLGFGFWSSNDGDFFSVPLVVSKLFGTPRAAFELGLGGTYLRAGLVAVGSRLAGLWDTGFKEQDAPPVSGVLLSGVAGFRTMVPGTGLVFRLAFTPFFAGVREGVHFSFLPWGGASLGWAFP